MGKPLVFVGTDAPHLTRLASITADAATSGALAAEELGQFIHGAGQVAIITGSVAIEDHAEKLRCFANSLAGFSPQLRLLPTIESHESAEEAYQAALELFRCSPQLRGLYINTANSAPVLHALRQSRHRQRIAVTATDLYPELVSLLGEGSVSASLYQRPFTQGRLAFETISSFLLRGEIPKRFTRLAPHIVLRSNLALFADGVDPDEASSQWKQ